MGFKSTRSVQNSICQSCQEILWVELIVGSHMQYYIAIGLEGLPAGYFSYFFNHMFLVLISEEHLMSIHKISFHREIGK